MTRNLLTWLSTAVLACVSLSSHAVPWGTPDALDEHDNVVSILFGDPASGWFTCTGTLLSPTVVLTAGHCTESEGVTNPYTFVRNDLDIDATLESELFPNYCDASGCDIVAWGMNDWTQGQAHPHPDYADFAGFPNTRDVGVVVLTQPIFLTNALYAQLPALGTFDSMDKAKGKQNSRFKVVGYGRQEMVPVPMPKDEWKRYMGEVSLINTKNVYTGGYNFQFTNNPGKGNGKGGTCFGDSGGPAFWADPVSDEVFVAAITSYGITKFCTGISFSYRTDIVEVLDFVGEFLD